MYWYDTYSLVEKRGALQRFTLRSIISSPTKTSSIMDILVALQFSWPSLFPYRPSQLFVKHIKHNFGSIFRHSAKSCVMPIMWVIFHVMMSYLLIRLSGTISSLPLETVCCHVQQSFITLSIQLREVLDWRGEGPGGQGKVNACTCLSKADHMYWHNTTWKPGRYVEGQRCTRFWG